MVTTGMKLQCSLLFASYIVGDHQNKVVRSSWICYAQPQNPQVLGKQGPQKTLQLDKARLERLKAGVSIDDDHISWSKSLQIFGSFTNFLEALCCACKHMAVISLK